MSLDEPTQEELDDAIIEDTVHCDLCGASWLLGGTAGGVVVNAPFRDGALLSHLKLCIACVGHVERALRMKLEECGECEHGELLGDWCEKCNEEWLEREADK